MMAQMSHDYPGSIGSRLYVSILSTSTATISVKGTAESVRFLETCFN